MKVLVTGGAGFIGSHIVDELIKKGFEVVVIDDLSTGFKKNLNSDAVFYQVDVCDSEKIGKIFDKEKPDFVNHHAAQNNMTRSIENPIHDANINIRGSLNIIINSIRTKVKKIIYASSGGLCYGEPVNIPTKEDDSINPTSPYGVSKHTVEHYLITSSITHSLKFTALRYANVYGPRQNPLGEVGVIAIFIRNLLKNERPTIFGNGNQKRDFIFVKDVVKANILAMDGDNKIFNVGTGRMTSINELFKILKKITNSNLDPIYDEKRMGDVQRVCLDITRIKKELNWKPEHELESGLSETVNWFKEELKK